MKEDQPGVKAFSSSPHVHVKTNADNNENDDDCT